MRCQRVSVASIFIVSIFFLGAPLAAQDSIQQFGHDTPMRDIDISPSGSSILTIDENGMARIWNADSGDPVRRVTFRDDGFQAGAFTDSTTLALTVPGGLAFVDAETGKGTVAQAQGVQEDKPVIAAGPNGEIVLVGGVAGKFDSWSTETRETLRRFVQVSDEMAAATVSSDGNEFFGVWEGGSFHFAKPGSASSSTFENLTDIVAAEFIGESSRVAIALADGRISVVKAGEREAIHSIPTDGPINDMALSPDGRLAVTAGANGMARLWHLATGTLVRTYHGHLESVDHVAFSPKGDTVLTAGQDEYLALLWRVPPPNDWRDFAVETALTLDKADWKAVQSALNEAGADAGVADGLPGPNTRRAIGQWQKANDLNVDGYLTPTQLRQLTGLTRREATIPRLVGDEAARIARARDGNSPGETDVADTDRPTGPIPKLARVNGPVGNDRCHVIAASRETMPEVGVFLAQLAPPLRETVSVARAKNGWYAISVGTIPEDAFNTTRDDLIDRELIPDDSFARADGNLKSFYHAVDMRAARWQPHPKRTDAKRHSPWILKDTTG